MRFPSPPTVAEQLAGALPPLVCGRIPHHPAVRRAQASSPDLTGDEWGRLVAVAADDHALRAQLVWHPLAAGRLAAVLHPGDDPATLAAALVAHPEEAALLISGWKEIPAAVADLVVAVTSDDDVRWAVAPHCSLPLVLKVALWVAGRSDDEVADLVLAALAEHPRPPEPPLLLLLLCQARPSLAVRFALTDPWLALPAVASGAADPAELVTYLADRRDPAAVPLAAYVAAHPDTSAELVAVLLAGVLAGHPTPWAPDPPPPGWGVRDRDRDADTHDLVVAAVSKAPEPWGRWVSFGMTEGRYRTLRVPHWVTPPTAELTAALGFRFGGQPSPPAPPFDPRWPTRSLAGNPERVAPTVAWLLQEVGDDPSRWDTLLSLADGFAGTVGQLAAVTPALD